MKKLPKVNTSKLLKAALPYILVGLMATKLGQAYRMASGGDVLDRIFGAFLKIGEAFANPLPSLHPFDLLVGDACGALLWFIVYQKSKNARKYRRGAEYGTARWGNAKDIEPFIDPDFSQNILLSETERLTLGKIADPEKRNVNLNVLVIGGSGSGKTRYHIKPNLLQMNASYVCSDPKGTVIEEVGRALVRGGYKIKVLNTIDFSCSMHYNPFVYLHSETDILTLVPVIMTNTQGEAKGGDGFWEKAEALLYQALIAYIYYEAPAEERNMNTLLDMLKEFYTIMTPDENVFYLIIDKQRDSENVYFLNAVTESDLMALAQKDTDSQTVTPTAPSEPEPAAPAEPEEPSEPETSEPEPEQPAPKSNNSMMFLVIVAALAAGGLGYYFKVYKPKHDLDDAEDIDDFEFEGPEEPTVNEDEEATGEDAGQEELSEEEEAEQRRLYEEDNEDIPIEGDDDLVF